MGFILPCTAITYPHYDCHFHYYCPPPAKIAHLRLMRVALGGGDGQSGTTVQ